MKNLLNLIGKSVLSALFFGLTLFFLAYAATTISGLGQKTIENGDKIGTGWFNDVDEQLSKGSIVPQGAVMAFDRNNCPDGWSEIEEAKGRVIVNRNSSDSDFSTIGKTGGEKTHQLTIDEMPSHVHDIYKKDNDGNNSSEGGTLDDHSDTWKRSNLGRIDPTGGDQPHNNLQPYIILLYCKKN